MSKNTSQADGEPAVTPRALLRVFAIALALVAASVSLAALFG